MQTRSSALYDAFLLTNLAKRNAYTVWFTFDSIRLYYQVFVTGHKGDKFCFTKKLANEFELAVGEIFDMISNVFQNVGINFLFPNIHEVCLTYL